MDNIIKISMKVVGDIEFNDAVKELLTHTVQVSDTSTIRDKTWNATGKEYFLSPYIRELCKKQDDLIINMRDELFNYSINDVNISRGGEWLGVIVIDNNPPNVEVSPKEQKLELPILKKLDIK